MVAKKLLEMQSQKPAIGSGVRRAFFFDDRVDIVTRRKNYYTLVTSVLLDEIASIKIRHGFVASCIVITKKDGRSVMIQALDKGDALRAEKFFRARSIS
ncbi:MAG: hypothetical protein JXR83_05225 [Deltaproteobacteria bacterium]|nr:hypothetical protein [Deltaproteobacteria bacterium]